MIMQPLLGLLKHKPPVIFPPVGAKFIVTQTNIQIVSQTGANLITQS